MYRGVLATHDDSAAGNVKVTRVKHSGTESESLKQLKHQLTAL